MKDPIFVIGPAKSGTSATAGVLRILGINFGTPAELGEWNNHSEHLGIVELVRRGKFGMMQELMALKGIQGAKHPTFTAHIDDLARSFETARFVFVWRDPYSMASRQLEEKMEVGRRAKAIDDKVAEQNWMIAGVRKWDERIVNLSYEKLLIDPAGQIAELAYRLNIDAHCERVRIAAHYVRPASNYPDIHPYLEDAAKWV